MSLFSVGCTDGALTTTNTSSSLSSKVLVFAGLTTTAQNVTSTTALYSTDSGAWTNTSAIPGVLPAYPAITILGNGKLLAAGGASTGALSDTNWFASVYNPSTNTWTATANMNKGRNQFGMTKLTNGNAIAVGGCSGGCISPNAQVQTFATVCQSAEIYDQTLGTWTNTTAMVACRATTPAVVQLQNGNVLVCGGNNGASNLGTIQTYDSGTGTWTNQPSPTVKRKGPSVVLPDGRVVLVGGMTYAAGPNWGLSSAIDIFNPTTNTWSSGGNLQFARGYHQVSLLNDGKILITGGLNGIAANGTITSTTATVEVYDPTTGKSSLPKLNGTRSFFRLANHPIIKKTPSNFFKGA
ncbi:MAG: kelch repeat-containing protein [Oligoflexia bacterium]|nr:kelch repeat-containing protein [Oligoflexia bacterium]